ncbi:hypothetical protein T4D_3666 [Trichinella pseudospiralis]|uniref:Uncharacterized protein n=1 Tax=Trichinella pseudospiralis TaxID=6337 RepID=A0A0V1FAG8_TRIPS|nr:hypothetical protein T4D_3666 [Trichinella pseudospiralis]
MAFNDAFLVVTNVRIENIFVENVNMKCINLHALQKLLETEIQQDMLVVFRKRESWRLNKSICKSFQTLIDLLKLKIKQFHSMFGDNVSFYDNQFRSKLIFVKEGMPELFSPVDRGELSLERFIGQI